MCIIHAMELRLFAWIIMFDFRVNAVCLVNELFGGFIGKFELCNFQEFNAYINQIYDLTKHDF